MKKIGKYDKAESLLKLLIAVCPALEDGMEREYRFHPTARWRFDAAWPARRVAVEIDGGQWVAHGGRHARDEDRVKLNEAAALGWRVLRLSTQQIECDPVRCADVIVRALRLDTSQRTVVD